MTKGEKEEVRQAQNHLNRAFSSHSRTFLDLAFLLGHLGDSWAAHVVPVPPSPYANVASAMIPDGGLHCNLNSWQRYLAAHLSEDEDFLPKDMWTYIHTPITQGFYGFGWMIDSSNNDIGDIVVYAMCVATFQQELF